MSDLVFWIVGLVVFVMIAAAFKKKAGNSTSLVVTGPGVRKIHDVECKFRSEAGYHGSFDQSRWSDGQERLKLSLRKLPGAFSGTVRLLHNGQHVADFDAKSGRITFGWKGMADADNPLFNIGDEIRLELGAANLTGIVEAD